MTIHLALQGAVPRSQRRAGRALSEAGIGAWLYLGTDSAWRLGAERTSFAGIDPLADADRFAEAAEELRRPFIDAIGELSQLNDSLEWWASELAAKNPYHGLFNRICGLAALPPDLGDSRALVVCDTPALLEEAGESLRRSGQDVAVLWGGESAAGRRAEELGRQTLLSVGERAPLWAVPLAKRLSGRGRSAIDKEPFYRARVLSRLGVEPVADFSGQDTVLLVTWADHRNLAADGSYVDPHFGPLADRFRERGLDVALMPRVLPAVEFEDCARQLLASGERLIFAETYLDRGEWADCRRRAEGFEAQVPDSAKAGSVPLARLAREDVERTAEHRGWALAYEAIVRKMAATGVRPARIVFPFEGHAWEQVLAASVRRHLPETEVIGYDNVNFSRFALSLYPSRSEIGRRPLPDRVVTNGPLFSRILAGEGFPEDAITTGCALRHVYLSEESVRPRTTAEPKANARPLKVLVASSIDLAQSVELLEKALAAFGGDSGYEVVIKCHPSVDLRAVRRLTRGIDADSNARFVETPISELLGSSDLMLYTYSVVCYEALAHGVPPVFVRSDTLLDLDQLEPFADLRWAGRRPEELRRAAEEIAALDRDQRSAWEERGREAVAEALVPPGPGCVDAFLS